MADVPTKPAPVTPPPPKPVLPPPDPKIVVVAYRGQSGGRTLERRATKKA